MLQNKAHQKIVLWASIDTMRILRVWSPIVQATGIAVAFSWGCVALYVSRLIDLDTRVAAFLVPVALGLSLGYVSFTSRARTLPRRVVATIERKTLGMELVRPYSISFICSSMLLVWHACVSMIPIASLQGQLHPYDYDTWVMIEMGSMIGLAYISTVCLLMRADIAKLVGNTQLRMRMCQLVEIE